MRAKHEPMEPIRNGSREFVPLDQLHLQSLHATLPEFGLNAAATTTASSATSTRRGSGWTRGRTASPA